MFINLVIVFVYFWHAVCADNAVALRKCCPQNTTLSVNQLNNYKIVCIPSDDAPIFGYNFVVDTEPFSPSCEWSARQYSDARQTLSLSGCVELIDGNLHVIECQPKSKPFVEVIQSFKCCPDGYLYDLEMRKCVETTSEISSFDNFYGAAMSVIFRTAVPQCDDDEVFIEYDTNVHSIFLNGNGLEIRDTTRSVEHLAAGSFCIDAAYRSKNDDLYVTQDTYRLIVRSCRPRDVCRAIPCVRRCCRSDQMLERRATDDSSKCYDHPERRNLVPMFHDVRPVAAAEVNVTGNDGDV